MEKVSLTRAIVEAARFAWLELRLSLVAVAFVVVAVVIAAAAVAAGAPQLAHFTAAAPLKALITLMKYYA